MHRHSILYVYDFMPIDCTKHNLQTEGALIFVLSRL